MNASTFTQEAIKIAEAALYYYFVEHDNAKLLQLFSQRNSNWIGWAFNEIYLGYKNVYDTFTARIGEIPQIEISELHSQIVLEADGLRIVFVTCHLATTLQTGYLLDEDAMYSFVIADEDGQAKIVHLHSSAAWKQMQQGEHFPAQRSKKRFRAYAENLNASSFFANVAARTPNGLKCCKIEKHYPAFYLNETLYKLAGYADLTEMLNATSGRLDKLVYAPDLPQVESAMLANRDGQTYTVNYRLMCKRPLPPLWVLEQGRACGNLDGSGDYFICSVTPLLLDDEINYGTLVDRNLIGNPQVPLEIFLQTALEIAAQNSDKELALRKILELSCNILQSSGAFIFTKDANGVVKRMLCCYDAQGRELQPDVVKFMTADICKRVNHGNFYQCNAADLLPGKERQKLKAADIQAHIAKMLPRFNDEYYILAFYQTGAPHSWTDNEKEVIEQAANIATLLLK